MALDDQMAFRVDSAEKNSFEATCRSANRVPADVMREIVSAFNENRLRVMVPKDKNSNQLEMYFDEH